MGVEVEGRREVRDKYLDRSVKMWVGQRGRGQGKARQCDCVNTTVEDGSMMGGESMSESPGEEECSG